jgi:hypothetical protein
VVARCQGYMADADEWGKERAKSDRIAGILDYVDTDNAVSFLILLTKAAFHLVAYAHPFQPLSACGGKNCVRVNAELRTSPQHRFLPQGLPHLVSACCAAAPWRSQSQAMFLKVKVCLSNITC